MSMYSCANGDKQLFLPPSRCRLLFGEQISLQQAVLPVAGGWCVLIRVWLEGWIFVSWRDTQRIPDLLHGTETDEWRPQHHGGCALARGTRAPWDHRAFLEVGGPLPADPNILVVPGSSGRNCHQSKNHTLLFPSVSYCVFVAFGLHRGTPKHACTDRSNQQAMQHLPLLKLCTVSGNNQ